MQNKTKIKVVERDKVRIKETVGDLTEVREALSKRIPIAEWMDNPDAFDKKKFVKETSNFMHDVYGISSTQDRHTLALLADQLEICIESTKRLWVLNETTGERELVLVIWYPNGSAAPNPLLTLRDRALKNTLELMKELAITPKGRMKESKGEAQEEREANELWSGPKV